MIWVEPASNPDGAVKRRSRRLIRRLVRAADRPGAITSVAGSWSGSGSGGSPVSSLPLVAVRSGPVGSTSLLKSSWSFPR